SGARRARRQPDLRSRGSLGNRPFQFPWTHGTHRPGRLAVLGVAGGGRTDLRADLWTPGIPRAVPATGRLFDHALPDLVPWRGSAPRAVRALSTDQSARAPWPLESPPARGARGWRGHLRAARVPAAVLRGVAAKREPEDYLCN